MQHLNRCELPRGLPGQVWKEWVAKLGVVREEADEALFWLIFIHRAGIATGRDVGEMLERPVNWPACLAQPIEQVPMANGSAPAGR